MRALLLRIVISAPLLAPIAACGGTTLATDSADGGGDANGGSTLTGSGDGGACSSSIVSFNLAVSSTDPVYLGGPQSQWPDSFACPIWLSVAPAGGAPITLDEECFHSCPRPQPVPPASQSYQWDGTAYTFADPATSSNGGSPECNETCAAPGNYVATFCVGYAGPDAGIEPAPENGSPTCTQVPFVWPPPGGYQSIDVTIAPTANGGEGP